MKIIKGIICVLIITVLFTGCGSSDTTETMTANGFKKSMEDRGVTVVDQTSTASDSTYQKIYVAIDEDKYSFEYYFMNNVDSADVVYRYAVSNLNEVYAEEATISEDEKNNIKKYCVSASDYYCEVLKKENTVLYVTAYHDYENEAKNIVKDLGYK